MFKKILSLSRLFVVLVLISLFLFTSACIKIVPNDITSKTETTTPTTPETTISSPLTTSKPTSTSVPTNINMPWKIAFVDSGNMYLMEADGSKRTQIPNYDINCSIPDWTDDGSHVAFVLNGDIYTMNMDGSLKTRLTNHGSGCYGPIWSPDNSRIAFSLNWQPYVINADGSNERRLTTNIGMSHWSPGLEWSPDSSSVAFLTPWSSGISGDVIKFDICIAKADGTSQYLVTPHDGYYGTPRWAPDSTRVAYTNGMGSIYVIKNDGSNLRCLTDKSVTDNPNLQSRGGYMAWSPDGSRIAYMADGISPISRNICVMNADGSRSVSE